jgi:hypothetical protein
LWPIAAGAGLAILMGRGRLWLGGAPSVVAAIIEPARGAALAFARGLVGIDGSVRQWPVAGLALLVVAIMFGLAMSAGR